MTELLVLRIVHVMGGVFWVGSGLFTGLFLMPALSAAGPAAGQVMGELGKRRLFVVLPVVALLTILSGLRLLWLMSGGFAAAYFGTLRGATFAASGAAAIVAFVLSLLVARPAAARDCSAAARTNVATSRFEPLRLIGLRRVTGQRLGRGHVAEGGEHLIRHEGRGVLLSIAGHCTREHDPAERILPVPADVVRDHVAAAGPADYDGGAAQRTACGDRATHERTGRAREHQSAEAYGAAGRIEVVRAFVAGQLALRLRQPALADSMAATLDELARAGNDTAIRGSAWS